MAWSGARHFCAVAAVLVSLPAIAFAQEAQTAAPASEHEDNSGQDPTRPVTRFDLRLKNTDNPGGTDSQLLTLRIDKPFELGGRWKLSTRADVPFIRTDELAMGIPTGAHDAGLSDMLVQALLITPPKGKAAFAFGTQLYVPTATHGLGSGRWQLAPSAAAVYQLPEVSRGTFVALLLRDNFSFAGDDPGTNVASVQPIFNWQLPRQWFLTFSPEAKFNTKDEWSLFLPFDVTVGKKLNATTVASLQADIGVIDDYPQYDWQIEARIGFFF